MLIDRTEIKFWLDDVCSDDLGIVVQGFPTFSAAEPRATLYSIPGRNGDLCVWDGSYKNISAEIKCYVANTSAVETVLAAANGWLNYGAYKKFVISSELGRYRLARVTNSAEIAIRMGVLAPFSVKLNCKPQRFYDDDTPRVFGNSGKITNPTVFDAKPLLRCHWASGAQKGGNEFLTITNTKGTCRIGLGVLAQVPIPDYIDVDLDSLSAVTSNGYNVPLSFEGGHPVFCPGDTQFASSNSLAGSDMEWFDQIDVYPRWWTL